MLMRMSIRACSKILSVQRHVKPCVARAEDQAQHHAIGSSECPQVIVKNVVDDQRADELIHFHWGFVWIHSWVTRVPKYYTSLLCHTTSQVAHAVRVSGSVGSADLPAIKRLRLQTHPSNNPNVVPHALKSSEESGGMSQQGYSHMCRRLHGFFCCGDGRDADERDNKIDRQQGGSR